MRNFHSQMFRYAVVTLLIVVTVADVEVNMDDDWGSFKQRYNKHYSTQTEEDTRRSLWEGNVKYIQQHNKEADIGIHSYRLGVNKFADMTPEEVVGKYTGFLDVNISDTSFSRSVRNNLDLPQTVDWRNERYVTRVKDQGQCGSCWAFSAIGALEGQHAKKTGKLVSLSAQNLVDCSWSEGNHGCGGGRMDWSYNYMKKSGGVDKETSYPYEGKDAVCRFETATIGATLRSYKYVSEGNETALQEAVATVGPIAVAVNAGLPSFQLYKSGVYDDPECYDYINHAVTLVGYGVSGNKAYWLVKNSWGESWGDHGYIKMLRSKNNQCGISSQALYPEV